VNDSWVCGDEYGDYYDDDYNNDDDVELDDDDSRGHSTAKERCGGNLDLRSHRSASRSAGPLAENRDKHKLGESILYFVKTLHHSPKKCLDKEKCSFD